MVKSKFEIWQNFVAFSEYMNFHKNGQKSFLFPSNGHFLFLICNQQDLIFFEVHYIDWHS